MAEDLVISKNVDKEKVYKTLFPQFKSLVEDEKDELANRANFCAAIKETFGFLWVGFYRVVDGELVLGPFQGPIACTRIKKGKGICGLAWENKQTLIVEDVNTFPGHISCNGASKSEIVIPIENKNGDVIAVLDIDHSEFNTFDEIDKIYLEKLLTLIT
jgi:GAF domain-containing protein